MRHISWGRYAPMLGFILSVSMMMFVMSYVERQPKKMTVANVYNAYNKLKKFTSMPDEIPQLVVEVNPQVNAWVNSSEIVFTTGMLSKMQSEDEIAIIMGHEMGHYMMNHLVEDGVDNRVKEANADKIGIFLVARAGYNLCVAKGVWERFLIESGESVVTTTHPNYTHRQWEYDFPGCPQS